MRSQIVAKAPDRLAPKRAPRPAAKKKPVNLARLALKPVLGLLLLCMLCIGSTRAQVPGAALPPPVNGQCLIGSGGQWVAGSCSGSGTSVTSVSGTSGQIGVSPTTGATVVSLPATITSNVNFTGTFELGGAAVTLPLPVAIGGTGDSTLTANALLIGNGTSAVQFLSEVDGDCAVGAGGVWTTGACGSGSGNVSSVGLALPSSVFSISGSPVTSSGTLTGAFVSQTANLVFASPNGSSGTPTFRALVSADLPSGTGTVTSVGLSAPSYLTVSGSPVTTSGTLAITGTSESANEVLASPNGSPGVLGPRALVAADIPALSSLTGSVTASGMLALATGDWYVGNLSNQPSATAPSSAIDSAFGNTEGDLLCRGASTWSTLAPSSTINYVLTQSTLNACPTWQPAPIPTLTTTLETANFNGSSATVFYGINGASITDTLSNPGTAVGAVYQGFSYDGTNSYTLATTSGTADFYFNGAASPATTITLPPWSSYNCVDASTYYACQITYGGVYYDAVNGLDLGGIAGSTNDAVLRNKNKTIVAEIPTASTALELGAALFINMSTPINTNDKISVTSGAAPAGIEMQCSLSTTYCYNYLGNNTSATQFALTVNGSADTTHNCATANCAGINPGSGGLWLDASNIASGAGTDYLCASAATGWAQVETSTTCGAETQTASLGWSAGVNPTQTLIVTDLPRAITLSSVVCRPEVAVGSTATVEVFIAASGTAIGSGTNVSSGSCNANGTAATNQSLTLTTTAVPAGDSIGIITTGTTDWTSGSGIGTISIYWTEQ